MMECGMNDGRVTIWIGKREALPVRAIPYVTSWQVSPDSIVRALAEPPTIKVGTNLEIRNKHSLAAYLMGDHGHYEPLPASQWKDCAVALNSLTQKLKADERKDATDENYGPWRVAAILKLPNNVFVWLDEFQSWYSATQPMLHREGDANRMSALKAEHKRTDSDAKNIDDLEAELFQTADDSLCLSPILPPEIEGKVWRHAQVLFPLDVVAGVTPPSPPPNGDAKLAILAQQLMDQTPQIGSERTASAESELAEQNAERSANEPFLKRGTNCRDAVQKWVAWQAQGKAKDFERVADIADSIMEHAKRYGYESARGKMTAANITKMIPKGLTGGRTKNKGRAKNRTRMLIGKGERKVKDKDKVGK